MPGDAILVVDAGTSGLRAVAIDPSGDVLATAAEPWPMFVPDDAAPFGREYDVARVECALHAMLVRDLVDRSRVAAIAFTGQREGIAFLDESGRAVFASPNIDARASAEGLAIDAEFAGRVYETTGHLPSLMQVPAKLRWMREHRPEVFRRIRYVLPLSDWLASLLTHRSVASRTLAAENGLLDIRNGRIASELLDGLCGDVAFVPEIVSEGTVVGRAMPAGLPGVPVVLAGADTQCALVGMGCIAIGAAGVPAGWSAPVQLVTSEPIVDGAQRTWSGMHVVPDRWIVESNAGETGRAWEWLCATLGVDVSAAGELAASAPVGSHDVMSVHGPRVMRASAMSAGVGMMSFPTPLVMSAPQRPDLLRAALEATAYAIRSNLEQLEAVAGATVGTLQAGGGMSRSPLFTQTLCDVIDRPVTVARSPETSAVGAAAIAAAAVGLHASLERAIASMCGMTATLEPDSRASSEYDDLYQRWCDLADHMERSP
ncbi:MAG TPA: FGGY-family carbohydrate kinase [Dehalococcoidia bacterium]